MQKTVKLLDCGSPRIVGTIPLAISVVSDIAPPHQRGKYVGAALCG